MSRQNQENTLTDQQEGVPHPAPVSPLAGSQVLLVPRWIQLVSLPIILLFGWIFAGAVRHAIFIFLISG